MARRLADRHAGKAFDYLIANPPYGKDWKRDEDAVSAELNFNRYFYRYPPLRSSRRSSVTSARWKLIS